MILIELFVWAFVILNIIVYPDNKFPLIVQ